MSPTVVRPLLLLAALLATLAGPSVAQAATPAPTALPTLSGTTRAGQTLTTTDGTWSGGGTMTYTRRWQRCDDAGDNCTLIPGASARTYVLQDADVGGTVRSLITAQNVDGAGPATASAPSDPIAPRQLPVNAPGDPVTLTGTPRDLQNLTLVPGTWTGTTPIAYTYRWHRCSGGTCTVIAGRSAATYTVQSADVGSTIRGEVTATNPDGATAATAESAPVTAAAPVNLTLPPLSGTARENQTLTSNAFGTWNGTPTIAYTRGWDRCDASGGACTPIPGETATTYRLTAADIGSTVRARVTATNSAGSTVAQSAASAVVTALAPPSNTLAPLITGQVTDAQTLTVSTGTWSGVAPIAYAYQWRRCDGLGTCTPIAGATRTTYLLTSGDVGYTIDAVVTATNPDGTNTENAPATVAVAPAAPAVTTAPIVSGSAREGMLLTASTGVWRGTPDIAYAYQWQSCVSGTCADIAGATGVSFRPTVDEVGENVRVVVTATNAGGSAGQPSATTAAVTAAPPTNVDLPAVSGPLIRDGQIVTANRGTWAGTATIVFNHQWMRCTAAGASCVAISGEVGPTYQLRSADVGGTVRLRVFAANGQGTVTADSNPSPVVASAPPSAAAGTPELTGLPVDGALLTAGGAWNGTPPIALTYLWERCDQLTSVCTTIPGATAATYRLTSADIDQLVRVTVGASNAGGGDQSTSTAVGPIVHQAPLATGTPTLGGVAREAADLTVSTTAFTGSPTMSYTATWERCDTAGAGCTPIPGATGLTRTLEAADRGHTVRAIVRAENPSGFAHATSELSAVVAASAPANRVVPAITPGTGLKDGVLLSVSDGGWVGSGPMSYAYAWERCDATGTSCATITGAVGRDLRLTSADVGFAVRATVTATNMAGHTAAKSLVTSVVGTNPPVNTTPPSITGTARDGHELRAAAGDWDGVVPFTTTYQWMRCDAGGDDCGAIPGATRVTYTLTPDDVGLSVRVQVLQSSAGGATAALSAPTAAVLASPPVNLVRPSIDGKAGVGRVVTARVGSWVGTPDLVYTYEWHRCDADGTSCAPIPGATTSSYRLLAADNDRAVKVRVTATNAMSSDTAESDTTAQISDDPPLMLVQPEITAAGLVADGQVVHVTDGVWSGAQPITYTYQWRRCDATGSGCVPITGATSSSYTLTTADAGRRVVAQVRAENAVADGVADTAPSPVVLPEPPSSLTKPIVSTTATAVRDGAVLSGTSGTWRGAAPITYTYAWLRCDSAGADCQEIPGAVAPTYTLASQDVGQRVVLRVTAKNGAAEVAAESDPTLVVAPSAPVATVRPEVVVLDVKPGVGGRVKATTGTWTGTAPMSLTLQWQRCPATSLAACDDIVGETSADYVLTTADVGRRVRVVVTATNAAATVTAETAPTAMVPAVAPESLTAPVVTPDGGVARDGVRLSATNGTWDGTAPLVFGRQWERCDDAGGSLCKPITGASGASYALVAADVGKWVRVVVTATNDGGKASRASLATAQVAAVAPANVTPPTATMKATVKKGTTVASTLGKWTGTEKLTYTQRWQRCDAAGNCADIPGADKTTYVLTEDDLATEYTLKGAIRVVVVAENAAGRVEVASAVAVATPGTPPPAKTPTTNTGTGTKPGGTGTGSSTGTKTGTSTTKPGTSTTKTGTSTTKKPTTSTTKKTTTSGKKKTSTTASGKKKTSGKATSGKGSAKKKGKKAGKSKSVAALRSARIAADGKLVLKLECLRKSRATCGVRGSYKGAAGVRGGLSVAKIARGRSVTKTIKLTARQLKALKGKKKLKLTLRMAAPATPTRPKVVKKTVKVPTAVRKGTPTPSTTTPTATPSPTTGTSTTPSTTTTKTGA